MVMWRKPATPLASAKKRDQWVQGWEYCQFPKPKQGQPNPLRSTCRRAAFLVVVGSEECSRDRSTLALLNPLLPQQILVRGVLGPKVLCAYGTESTSCALFSVRQKEPPN